MATYAVNPIESPNSVAKWVARRWNVRQTQEGWYCLPIRYDDGGFTGGNMDRPALRQLLADIEAGKVNCVVVCTVDRLSRSRIDFARILEVFERN